jgi:hypothetical protein
MPLRDHFHPPLHPVRHWGSFLATWAVTLADSLNGDLLPKHHYAEIHLSGVAARELDLRAPLAPSVVVEHSDEPTAAAASLEGWAPPTPVVIIPTVFARDFEVLVFQSDSTRNPVAVIELAGPADKEGCPQRLAFATKCASYLYRGVSLIVVDIVTNRQAPLHKDILQLLDQSQRDLFPSNPDLYGVAFRPIIREEATQIDIWPHVLAVGQALPVLPLWLRGDLCLPIDLETTYAESCRRLRIT